MAASLSDMFGNRKAPNLAIEFRAEEIALFVLEGTGWREISACRIDAPDLNDRAADMRRIAAKRSAAKIPDVDVWLPAQQVAMLEFGATSNPRQTALEALTASSALTPDELVVDIVRHGRGNVACAAEKIVVEEARHYIRRWGFQPQRVTTRHGHLAFAAGPTFGRSDIAPKPEVYVGVAAAALLAVGLGWLVLGGPSDDPESAQTPTEIVATEASPPPDQTAALEAASDENAVAATPAEDPVETDDPAAPIEAAAAARSEAISAPEPALKPAPSAPTAIASGDRDNAPRPADLLALSDAVIAETTTIALTRIGEAPPTLGGTPAPTTALFEPATLPALVLATPFSGAVPPDGPIQMASLGDAPSASPIIGSSPETSQPDVAAPESEAAETPLDEEPSSAAEDEATPSIAAIDRAVPDDVEARRDLTVSSDPRQATAVEEAEDAPGPGAVASAPAPAPRPDSLDMTPSGYAVAAAPAPAARPASIRPRPRAQTVAATSAVSRVERGPPAGPGLANAATLRDALQLTEINLLGVFGQPGSRRALLRLGNGDVMRVSRGTVVDGWVVSRIEAASMRITRGGEARTLQLIQ
ncbi:MAG: hypothetical protein AAFN79_12550 [Pseudomonadota bacterium]